MTEAVRVAVEARLARERRPRRAEGLAQKLDALAKELATAPSYDTRGPDEIVGYDEHGMW